MKKIPPFFCVSLFLTIGLLASALRADQSALDPVNVTVPSQIIVAPISDLTQPFSQTETAAPSLDESEGKTFQSRCCTIYYSNEKELEDFFWRLGADRNEYLTQPSSASNRVDRLARRVQFLMDMWPEDFHVDIHLTRDEGEKFKEAHYTYASRAIKISVEYLSDGILAHEFAHAVIDQFFDTPPPSKMQEILAQYVDRNLWSDY